MRKSDGLGKKATDKPEREEEDYHIILLEFFFQSVAYVSSNSKAFRS